MSDKKISQLTASTTPLTGAEVLPVVQSGVTKQVSVANLTAGRDAVASTLNASSTNPRFFLTDTDGFSSSINGNSGHMTFSADTGNAGSGSRIDFEIDAASLKARLDSNGNFTLYTGNVVIGTAGKGIDFSADGQAAGMTSELLDDYEEGTWTPTLGGDATYNFQSGVYTKIGRLVIANCILMVNTIGTGATNNVSGLPFTVRSQTQNFSGSCQYFESLANTIVYIAPSPNAGADSLTFFTLAAAGGTTSYNTALWQNGTRIDFTVMYFT